MTGRPAEASVRVYVMLEADMQAPNLPPPPSSTSPQAAMHVRDFAHGTCVITAGTV
jgi:hypothetical protein